MATNLFSRAAAYRKTHPSVSQAEAVKILSRQDKKKPATRKKAVGKAPKKKAAKKRAVGKAPAKKATKVTIKAKKVTIGKAKKKKAVGYPNQAKQWGKDRILSEAKKVGLRLVHGYETQARRVSGMSGVGLAELERNVLHLQNLEKIQVSTREMLKDKRQKMNWPDLRRQLTKNAKVIAATKKHITALKRSI